MRIGKKERKKRIEQFVNLLYEMSWGKPKYYSIMADLIEILERKTYNQIINELGEMTTKQQANCLMLDLEAINN